MIYEVVYCSDCKKPVKSVPSWLADVNVRFTCETCRQKHPRGMASMDNAVPVRAGYNGASSDGAEASEAPGELVDEEPIEDLDAEAEESGGEDE